MEMGRNRLEAFSDGVIAIVITLMVLEMKIQHGGELADLRPVVPVFLTYVLSFIYLAIYWNNHHHMLHATNKVTAYILWANMHLLFWLSLFPFVTGWMGMNHFSPIPTLLYGVVLFCAAAAYFILQHAIICSQGKKSILSKAVGKDFKGKLSLFLYAIGIVFSIYVPIIATLIYILVALMWLIPDRRIEQAIRAEH